MTEAERTLHGVPVATEPGTADAEVVMDALRGVIDPELGVNVVDLGLIYGVRLERRDDPDADHDPDPATDPEDHVATRVSVRMTLTTPGCPLHAIIHDDATARLARVPGVAGVVVDLVFEPPWTPHRIRPAGRVALGWVDGEDRTPLPYA